MSVGGGQSLPPGGHKAVVSCPLGAARTVVSLERRPGMLSNLTYVLAMDVFGPIADNAAGIVETRPAPPISQRGHNQKCRSSTQLKRHLYSFMGYLWYSMLADGIS